MGRGSDGFAPFARETHRSFQFQSHQAWDPFDPREAIDEKRKPPRRRRLRTPVALIELASAETAVPGASETQTAILVSQRRPIGKHGKPPLGLSPYPQTPYQKISLGVVVWHCKPCSMSMAAGPALGRCALRRVCGYPLLFGKLSRTSTRSQQFEIPRLRQNVRAWRGKLGIPLPGISGSVVLLTTPRPQLGLCYSFGSLEVYSCDWEHT